MSPRLQAAAAFSPDGQTWYLVNATPDITAQLSATPALHPKQLRQTPIRGVVLTDGELDHVLGLVQLREGAGWALYATDSTSELLVGAFPALEIVGSYVADAAIIPLSLSEPHTFGEGDARVTMHVLETGTDLPRYAGTGERAGAVVALIFTTQRGKKLVYTPGVSHLGEALTKALQDADIILFDGTLYTDDELPTLGIGQASAADMGHIPMSGPAGSAAFLSALPAAVKRYVHINNTNPALNERSAARAELRAQGLELAEDGWEVEL